MNDSDQGDFINTLAMSQQEHCIILIILICADEGTLRTDRKLYYKTSTYLHNRFGKHCCAMLEFCFVL